MPKQSFYACATAKFTELSLKHKKEHNSDIKRDKLMEFQLIVCWISGKHYLVLVIPFINTLPLKIKHCSVAFSLLPGILITMLTVFQSH